MKISGREAIQDPFNESKYIPAACWNIYYKALAIVLAFKLGVSFVPVN